MLPLETPPQAISATFTYATRVLVITFDKLLVDGVSDADNYAVYKIDGTTFKYTTKTGVPANVRDYTVSVALATESDSSGPERAEYLASPADLVGRNGLTVAADLAIPVSFV